MESHLADRFTRHLHARLEDGENVEEIARRFGGSRSSLLPLVRKRCGTTPSALIIEARLARAQLLLETTDHSANDLARRSGYRSPEHFHRQFQKHYGVTPQEWRFQKRTESGWKPAGWCEEKETPSRKQIKDQAGMAVS